MFKIASKEFSILADAFNLLHRYHLTSPAVMNQFRVINTLHDFINIINDTRKEDEKIGVNPDTQIIFDLLHNIDLLSLFIINRDKQYYKDYKRTDELCKKLFGDKTESEIVEMLNNHVVQMRKLIDDALC